MSVFMEKLPDREYLSSICKRKLGFKKSEKKISKFLVPFPINNSNTAFFFSPFSVILQ